VLPGEPQQLSLTYWGEDRGRYFDVLVDGRKLATQRLTGAHPGKFFEEVYGLPPEVTRGKTKLTLRIQGSAETWAGGIFGVRVLKEESKP